MMGFLFFIFSLVVFIIGFFTLPFALGHYVPLLFGKKVKKLQRKVALRYLATLVIFFIIIFQVLAQWNRDETRKDEIVKQERLEIPTLEFSKESKTLKSFQKYSLEDAWDGLKIHFASGTTLDGFLCDTSQNVFVNKDTGGLAECVLAEGNIIGGFMLPAGFKIVERTRSYAYKFNKEDTMGIAYHWEIRGNKELEFNGIVYDDVEMRITKQKKVILFEGNRASEYWDDTKMRALLE